jgi:alpha-glucosidase (family GH31 glycosyl hydrolase)
MGDSFASGRDEAFHGLGGRHWGVNQRGHTLYGWIEQENIGGPATLASTALLPGFVEQGTGRSLAALGQPDLTGALPGGPEHYMFPGGPGAAYTVHNQFVSSRPYAFLLNRNELSRWRMDSDRPDAWQVQATAPKLDYTVAVGAAHSATGAISAITGRELLPPAWAQGPNRLAGQPEHRWTIGGDLPRQGRAGPRRHRALAPALGRVRVRGLGPLERRRLCP